MKFGTILIVDDDPLARKVITDMFNMGNLSCTKILYRENGCEGLECIRENDIDLLIVDHEMPGMTGEELITRLTNECPPKMFPILFLTGTHDLGLTARMLYRGCSVLHKPVTYSVFERSLNDIIKEHGRSGLASASKQSHQRG